MTVSDLHAWPEIHTTKLDAARRQLDAAIRLLFSGGDSLAIHTLAFASYGLLSDLAKVAECSEIYVRLSEDSKLREGKEFWNDLKKLSNYLKHADKDPEAYIRGIPVEINEATLLICCFFLRELDQLSSPETQALWLWHHALYFINIDDAPKEYWEWIDDNHQSLHSETRREKIEIGEGLLNRLLKEKTSIHKMEPDQVFMPWRLIIRPTTISS